VILSSRPFAKYVALYRIFAPLVLLGPLPERLHGQFWDSSALGEFINNSFSPFFRPHRPLANLTFCLVFLWASSLCDLPPPRVRPATFAVFLCHPPSHATKVTRNFGEFVLFRVLFVNFPRTSLLSKPSPGVSPDPLCHLSPLVLTFPRTKPDPLTKLLIPPDHRRLPSFLALRNGLFFDLPPGTLFFFSVIAPRPLVSPAAAPPVLSSSVRL